MSNIVIVGTTWSGGRLIEPFHNAQGQLPYAKCDRCGLVYFPALYEVRDCDCGGRAMARKGHIVDAESGERVGEAGE